MEKLPVAVESTNGIQEKSPFTRQRLFGLLALIAFIFFRLVGVNIVQTLMHS